MSESTDPRQALFDLLESGVADGAFPGAVALVWHAGSTLYHEAHGAIATHSSLSKSGHSTKRDTIYDLASLTKILCTTTLTALAVGEGLVEIDDDVPEPWSRNIPGATLGDLLEHCAGLEAHREYFAEVEPYDADAVVQRVIETPARSKPRVEAVYSDLGFMILGRWLERIYDKPLADAFGDAVAFRLSLDLSPLPQLGFRPLHGLPRLDPQYEGLIAPTEVYDAALHPDGVPSHFDVRKKVPAAHGAVHDDNAFVMGGVAGHAGLFGTAQGVLDVATAWARCSLPGLKPSVRDRFWRPSSTPGSTRRLGFDGPSADGGGTAGSAVQATAVGHTGYTGTSVWIDPDANGGPKVYVLLTNRVHPVRTNDAIKRFRPRFHETAARLS